MRLLTKVGGVVVLASVAMGMSIYPDMKDMTYISTHKLTHVEGNPTIPDDLKTGIASIVMVHGELLAGSGSGFLVAPGVVMTAGHCIDQDASNVRIVIDGHEYTPVGSRVHNTFSEHSDNGDVGFYYLTEESKTAKINLRLAKAMKGMHLRGAGFGAGDYAQFLEGQVILEDLSSLQPGDTHSTLGVYSEGGFSGSVMFADDGSISGVLVRGFPAAPRYDGMDEYEKALKRQGYIPGPGAIYGKTMYKYATHLTNVQHIQELVDQHNNPEQVGEGAVEFLIPIPD